ncbi:hypothetical protein D9M68_659960 [compost metagenome]
MLAREFVERKTGLHRQHAHRPVGQAGRELGREPGQRLAHALGLLHVGLQGVVEHAGHGVAGDGAGGGFAGAVAAQAGALGLSDANHQDAPRTELDGGR